MCAAHADGFSLCLTEIVLIWLEVIALRTMKCLDLFYAVPQWGNKLRRNKAVFLQNASFAIRWEISDVSNICH
jgi:hypothetical protein